ncbi:hypothetical protein SPF06_07595 [Sinomonas sp. JGH33]|uniref:Integral membrane protein n=1 Tax=Sinomonas terricola TaxID=3110330 RepID=A0ABU5T4J4_9MICC|nr:hypothetical protein [Sinomonas sp. JGH33]MEA5454582.1 hypothetical protein [Sinomonas sp. JGH33]
MITDAFFWIGVVVCAVSLLICLVATVTKRYPGDAAIISVAAVELFLVVFAVGAAIRQGGGQPVRGEPWEFWGYVATAFVLPIAGFWWAVLDKTRWSNVVLAAVPVTVFVMLFRMEQIWNGAF